MIVTRCQSCDSPDLDEILSLGDLPAANQYFPIGYRGESKRYPHDLLHCRKCELVQLGYVAPYQETFPADYPYLSGTTRALRENFADLAREVKELCDLKPDDLVVDIGGNDGTLLSNFEGHRRVNVTPESAGQRALDRWPPIPWIQAYWDKRAAADVLELSGKAKVVTATNVFAHVPDPHGFLDAVLDVLAPDGVLVLECQYLLDLVTGLQFDHLYTEHLRFFSFESLTRLTAEHGLGVTSWKRIGTHGGSIRVTLMRIPASGPMVDGVDFGLGGLAKRVAESKADLWSLLSSNYGAKIAGIGAPSRASTLINYVGIDHNVCPYICETGGSAKLGKYMPGTRIPIVPEDAAALDVDYLLLLAHHIADDLMPAIRAKGFRGKLIKPLPRAEVIG